MCLAAILCMCVLLQLFACLSALSFLTFLRSVLSFLVHTSVAVRRLTEPANFALIFFFIANFHFLQFILF